jgi:hypothetical protein
MIFDTTKEAVNRQKQKQNDVQMNGVFKILQYSEMECNCVGKITEGVFRKYSTL